MTTPSSTSQPAAAPQASRVNAAAGARWLGWFVITVGLLSLVSTLLPDRFERLHTFASLIGPVGTDAADGAAAVFALGLVFLGRGLIRGHRVAYWLTLGLLILSVLAHVARGFDLAQALLALAMAIVLVASREAFTVPLEAGRPTRVLGRLLGALGLVVAFGLVGLWARRDELAPAWTLPRAGEEVAARLIGLSGPFTVTGRFGDWFPATLTVLGALLLVLVVSSLLAPIALRGSGTDEDRARAGALVERSTDDTLAPFLLRRDKRYVFSSDRSAVIGYRYVNGVGLAAGDVVGNQSTAPEAVAAFVALCTRNGWKPANYGVRESHLDAWTSNGLSSFYIGDEAVIEVADFSLTGRRMRPVRLPVNHTVNCGIAVDIRRDRDIDDRLRQTLRRVAEEQRGGDVERGYAMTMGDLLSGAWPDAIVAISVGPDGEPVGFQRYLPCRGGRALSLDVMRRGAAAPNGVNERMIVEVVEWGRARGIDEVSLNFAAFRRQFDNDVEHNALESMQGWFVQRLEGRFGVQMDSLRRFNAKFLPRWEPRHLVFDRVADLPAVGLAALNAEGFLPFDRGRQADA
jgi:lysyl-tRNA synthetase, class II